MLTTVNGWPTGSRCKPRTRKTASPPRPAATLFISLLICPLSVGSTTDTDITSSSFLCATPRAIQTQLNQTLSVTGRRWAIGD